MSGTGSHRESATHRHWSPIINCQLRSLRSNYTHTHRQRSHSAARMPGCQDVILMPVPKSLLEATCSPPASASVPRGRSGRCAALLYPGTAAPCCAWLVLAWLVAGGWPTLHAQNYLWSEVLVMGNTMDPLPGPSPAHRPTVQIYPASTRRTQHLDPAI